MGRGQLRLFEALVIASFLAGCATVQTPYAVIPEHELVVVEEGTPRPVPVVEPPEKPPLWDWATKHLAAGQVFADPFVGPEVYPEVSLGARMLAAHIEPSGAIGYRAGVSLSLYALDLEIPVFTTVDGGQLDPGNVRANLKIPFSWPGAEQHRFAINWGAVVLDDGPSLSQSSKFELLYGYGAGGFTAQLRAGYGYEQLFADQPLRLGLVYGALLGFGTGTLQPVLEVSGLRTVTSEENEIVLVPGLRIHPAGVDYLQLGVGGLVVLATGDNERYGAVVDLSFNFL